MGKAPYFSFQHKVILLVLLLVNIPLFLAGYMAKNISEGMILSEKQNKLLLLTKMLDESLAPEGFAGILQRHNAENASRDEKIKILNSELEAVTDRIGHLAPALGVGHYSRELDAIVTYGPSEEFGNVVGRSIPATHPGRMVMATNQSSVQSGSMVRGDIMNAMRPVVRNGHVIGYVWANELTTDISAQIAGLTHAIAGATGLCFVLIVGTIFLLSRRTLRDLDTIQRGLRKMHFDLSWRIPKIGGDMGEVVNSINSMAEDIERANDETKRAIGVLQSVMGNVEAIVYVCDPATKRLVYMNEYLCKLLKRDEDVQGMLCYEVLQGNSKPCDFCPQTRLFDKAGEPLFDSLRWEVFNPVVSRDFMVTDRLITWHDGRILHMEVGTDITERNALAMAEAANVAQRDFLARMSHELRTPMNGVLGMTQLAMRDNPSDNQLEYLKKIQSSASLLLGIINDILDFSRIEAGKMVIEQHGFSLHDMVLNIRELIFPRTEEKNLELRISIDESVPKYVMGDELRISQVLLNLLGNAAKFTMQGYVALHMRSETLEQGRAKLFCTISDSGIGMSKKQQETLFMPFSQADVSTSRKFGGTGLGLSISKTMVELMGGTITVSSKPEEGSVFSFYVELELLASPPDEQPHAENEWENVRYEDKVFLLVEDNVINQEIAVYLLEEMGAVVDVANDGEEGVQAFLNKDYSIILMDIRMPILDGLEATRRIRASGKHDALSVPIIAMTANVMHEDRESSRNAGMNAHIAKPIDMIEMRKILHQLVFKTKKQ